jgi:hypothetical protein
MILDGNIQKLYLPTISAIIINTGRQVLAKKYRAYHLNEDATPCDECDIWLKKL